MCLLSECCFCKRANDFERAKKEIEKHVEDYHWIHFSKKDIKRTNFVSIILIINGPNVIGRSLVDKNFPLP